MVKRRSLIVLALMTLVVATLTLRTVRGQATPPPRDPALDGRVKAFLDGARGSWHDLNVPYEDGKVLHDLIVERGFKSGLEIGTSTGHSGTWIAWAMSQTGGKLVTLEIDEGRHKKALANFEAAGVAPYVDARLGDAHSLVKELKGPFDFVFSDADKEWYTQYFKDVDPKLAVGGCFTAHNVLQDMAGIREFVDYVRSRPDYRTTIDRTSSSGISISCKTR
jgi:predicted O-methyltransferase YrrM